MKKFLTILLACLLSFVALFTASSCSKTEKRDIWYCYQVWSLSSGTLDVKEYPSLEISIEFFDDNTFLKLVTQDGKTSSFSGTYIINESTNGYSLYNSNGDPIGIASKSEDGKTMQYSNLDVYSMQNEYYQRGKVKK